MELLDSERKLWGGWTFWARCCRKLVEIAAGMMNSGLNTEMKQGCDHHFWPDSGHQCQILTIQFGSIWSSAELEDLPTPSRSWMTMSSQLRHFGPIEVEVRKRQSSPASRKGPVAGKLLECTWDFMSIASSKTPLERNISGCSLYKIFVYRCSFSDGLKKRGVHVGFKLVPSYWNDHRSRKTTINNTNG